MTHHQIYAAHVAFVSWSLNGSTAVTRFDVQAALALYDLHRSRIR